LEKRVGRSHCEICSELYIDRHYFSIRGDEEKFFAITPPMWLTATLGRYLPLAAG